MQAGSRLYARRLRGDIGPLQTDPRTRLPGRIIAPAVSLTGVYQDYEKTDLIKNFAIGSRMVVDERTFHYARAVAPIIGAWPKLCVSFDQILANNDRLSVVDAPALATQITVDVAAGPAFQTGVVLLDELVGGWVEINFAGQFMWRKIIANTANVGGNITITVDRPLDAHAGVPSLVTIHPSIYRNVSLPFLAGFNAAIGAPPVIPIPIHHYFWLQTYGPCFLGPTSDYPLGVANNYDIYFHLNGDSGSFTRENSVGWGGGGPNVSVQRVGHAMGSGAYGVGSVMLEIAS